jgi:hypothetical protein
VFHGREYHDEFAAEWADELPAYIELTMETADGLYAEWMFEIGWTSGGETAELEDVLDTGDDQGEGEPGGVGGTVGEPGSTTRGGSRLGQPGAPGEGGGGGS